MRYYSFLVCFFVVLFPISSLFATNQIKIVGSGTVYPFSTIITEIFVSKNPQFSAPIVESIGTGSGFKMFCQSAGLDSPDINNASRKIKESELSVCHKNGVDDILEINFGYDSIVLIQSKSIPQINLTSEQIYLGLAAQVPSSTGSLIANPYKNWSEIDNSLPNIPIKIIGPAPLSGTRETFIELVMKKSCHNLYKKGAIKTSEEEIDRACSSVRTDGAYINGGENYILFIQKVSNSIDTIAIIGYSFYEQNERNVAAIKINGIAPNKKTLDEKSYPLLRPLYIYVKRDKIGIVKGLKEFILETTSKEAIGKNGYLKRIGLIPLTQKEYNNVIKELNL